MRKYLQDQVNESLQLISKTKYLWILTVCYSMALVSANWFDPRLLNIFFITTGAGALLFPFTYLFSDIITEVYGFKNARLAVWTGLLFNIIFLVIAQLITLLPAPSHYDPTAFNGFLQFNMRIVIASITTYIFTEALNSYCVAKLKVWFAGKYLALRFLLATMLAHAANIILFGYGAFYGTMSNPELLHLLWTSWLLMVSLELILLPASIKITRILKQREQVDIYDTDTNFNIFSINANYAQSANEFEKLKQGK